MRIRFGRDLADGLLRSLSHRRQAVREEQNDGDAATCRLESQRLDQRVVDVRPAPHADALDVGAGGAHRFGVLDHRLGREQLDRLVIHNDVEGLTVLQSFQHLQRRGSGLLQLLAGHAAGTVEHKNDLALERAGGRRFQRRARQQEEITAADLRIGIRQQRRGDALSFEQVGQPERARLGRRVGGDARGDLGCADPRGFQFVARRIDRGDRRPRLDAHRDVPGNMVVDGLRARQRVVNPVAVGREQMLIDDADLLRRARLDGEDARTDETVADKFEQGGIAGLGHDFVVEFAGFFTGEKLGCRFAGGALKIEAAQRRLLRHWDDHLRFEPCAGVVGKADVERGGGDLFEDLHGNGHLGDRHRARRVGRKSSRLRHDDVRGEGMGVRVGMSDGLGGRPADGQREDRNGCEENFHSQTKVIIEGRAVCKWCVNRRRLLEACCWRLCDFNSSSRGLRFAGILAP